MREELDLMVVGSGAAGLAAAVTAASLGLRVLVLEKTDFIGGTTAWSGGWIWAPGNPVARRAGIVDDPAGPRQYLQAVLGNHFNPQRIDAFLAEAPEMVAFFESQTALQFDGGFPIPDTYGHQLGAGMAGRSVIAKPYDGRDLGKSIGRLRKPLSETTFFGMTIQAGADLRAFMTMTRSWRSFLHAVRRTIRHFRDLALHGRGMDLRNGSALAARLYRSALDLGVEFRLGVKIADLIEANGAVTGLRLADGEELIARKGVVLACGGYPHDAARRAATFVRDREHFSLAVPSATGDGIRLAEAVGAKVDVSAKHHAAMCPVSVVPRPDGSVGHFPHIIDRGKPGVIGVLKDGKRFCNEGLGYHDYVEALLNSVAPDEAAESWLVCDLRFLRRYGLGIVRPQPVPWRSWVRRGYLKTSGTIPELAKACGIDPAGLEETIAAWNHHATAGEDPAFGRGATAYMRLQGDPEQTPNPNVAPIAKPPFFAVKVVPGSFGTFAGLSTDGNARVLRPDGSVIDGLYAAGTDAASVFGGFYPAGGINLGPAMTFGFIAGRHAAGDTRP
jgi:succinate dehydrogenase/fumarate reductase flavoprotein subunit